MVRNRIKRSEINKLTEMTLDDVMDIHNHINDLFRELTFYEVHHIVGIKLQPIFEHFAAESSDEKALLDGMRRTVYGMKELHINMTLLAAA
jgi:hypothetical protein